MNSTKKTKNDEQLCYVHHLACETPTYADHEVIPPACLPE
jgi:hypothetical protein